MFGPHLQSEEFLPHFPSQRPNRRDLGKLLHVELKLISFAPPLSLDANFQLELPFAEIPMCFFPCWFYYAILSRGLKQMEVSWTWDEMRSGASRVYFEASGKRRCMLLWKDIA